MRFIPSFVLLTSLLLIFGALGLTVCFGGFFSFLNKGENGRIETLE